MEVTIRSSLFFAVIYLLKYELSSAHRTEKAQGIQLDMFLASSKCGGINHNVRPEYLDMLLNTSQYDEFSKLMRIEDSSIVRPAAGPSTPRDLLYNDTVKGKVQGDILLRRWQQRIIQKGLSFAEHGISKWKNRVPYVISENYSQRCKKVIEDEIYNFNSKVQNLLVPYNAEIDYVFIFPGAGFYSNLGKVGGPQAISLADFGDLVIPLVLHRLGHAMGLGHEHTRPDRDQYIHVFDENIPQSMKTQYNKAKAKDFLIIGPYDIYSVMHYPVLLLGSNATAIEVLQDNVNITAVGQTLVLTDADVYKINKLCRST